MYLDKGKWKGTFFIHIWEFTLSRREIRRGSDKSVGLIAIRVQVKTRALIGGGGVGVQVGLLPDPSLEAFTRTIKFIASDVSESTD